MCPEGVLASLRASTLLNAAQRANRNQGFARWPVGKSVAAATKPAGRARQHWSLPHSPSPASVNVVLDTNVVIAALRSKRGASHAVVQRIRKADGLMLHLSTAVVLEYEEVLLREVVPALGGTDEVAHFLDDLISVSVQHARITPWRPLSIDPDDDSFIELALTADADCIVTFNKSHLRPAEENGIALLTPGELLQQLIS